MTKLAEPNEPAAVAIDNGYNREKATTKSVTAFAMRALRNHVKSQKDMHDAACRILDHLALHRNPGLINTFYDSLPKNDKDAFRIWIRNNTKLPKDDGTFTSFLKFQKEKFEIVAKHPSDYVADYATLLAGPSFFTIDQTSETKAMTAERIFAMIAQLSKSLHKKREELSEEEEAKLNRFAHLFGEVDRIAAIASEAMVKTSPKDSGPKAVHATIQ